MSATDLARIQTLAATTGIVILGDAIWSMGAQGASYDDVLHVLATATGCAVMGAGWVVTGGATEDGMTIKAVVEVTYGRLYLVALVP